MEVKVVRVNINDNPSVVLVSKGLVNDPLHRVRPLQVNPLLKLLRVLPLQGGRGGVREEVGVRRVVRGMFMLGVSEEGEARGCLFLG